MVKDVVKANEAVKPNDREMAVLKEHFADCFNTDGTFDLGKFQARLGDGLAVSSEGYELNFLGKNYARLLTAVDTTTVVVPDEEHNAQPENAKSENVYISGDNLDALKHLLKSYARQVKCIYIDPPYNTGTDGFVYNDKFNFTPAEIADKLNLSDEQAERILQFAKRGSASHSAWLMFMYPRLQLARDLLSDDGVIFISIDDNEQANLKLLCDGIFGEENFIGGIIHQRAKGGGIAEDIVKGHDYILTYSRTPHRANLARKKVIQKKTIIIDGVEYLKDDDVVRKVYGKYEKGTERRCFYEQLVEYWGQTKKDEIDEKIQKGELFLEQNDTGMHTICRLIKVDEATSKLYSIIRVLSEEGKNDLDALGIRGFNYPKPVELVSQLIEAGTDKESIVVDFFSGSATTGHAAFLNNLDGRSRKVILVQLPINLDEQLLTASGNSKKVTEEAISFLDEVKRPHTLDEIGIERIKRAAAKIAAENPQLAKDMDLGFKHYTLKEPTGEQLEKIETFNPEDSGLIASDDILKEFGVPTVLATWLVRDGYGLTATPTKVVLDGYTAWWMKNHLYFIEAGAKGLTEDGIVQLMEKYETDAEFNPANVVIFGYGGLSWTMRENLEKNLQKLQPDNNAAGAKKLAITIDVRY